MDMLSNVQAQLERQQILLTSTAFQALMPFKSIENIINSTGLNASCITNHCPYVSLLERFDFKSSFMDGLSEVGALDAYTAKNGTVLTKHHPSTTQRETPHDLLFKMAVHGCIRQQLLTDSVQILQASPHCHLHDDFHRSVAEISEFNFERFTLEKRCNVRYKGFLSGLQHSNTLDARWMDAASDYRTRALSGQMPKISQLFKIEALFDESQMPTPPYVSVENCGLRLIF